MEDSEQRIKNSFNPRTSCEVRQDCTDRAESILDISIHAPRVRCDYSQELKGHGADYFNPRTSCEVRRLKKQKSRQKSNFNPRTSCEVRPFFINFFNASSGISIHAPRVRCDAPYRVKTFRFRHFNPRTSCEVRQTREYLLFYHSYFNPRTSCEVRLHLPAMLRR